MDICWNTSNGKPFLLICLLELPALAEIVNGHCCHFRGQELREYRGKGAVCESRSYKPFQLEKVDFGCGKEQTRV